MAHGGALGFRATAQQHRAGMDAHAHAEADDAQLLPNPLRMLGGRLQDLQARPHGVRRLVLARAHRAEGGLESVAGEAQHLAAAALHDRREALQGLAEQLVGIGRTDLRQQLCGVGDIDEQHAYLPQALARCRRRERRRGMAAQRLDRSIDRAVAQRGTLPVQQRNRGFQRIDISHGGPMLVAECAGAPAVCGAFLVAGRVN